MDRPKTGRRNLTTRERHTLLAKALAYELKQLQALAQIGFPSQVRGFTSACHIVEKVLDVRILKDGQEGPL